jgi:hypothetical protein
MGCQMGGNAKDTKAVNRKKHGGSSGKKGIYI